MNYDELEKRVAELERLIAYMDEARKAKRLTEFKSEGMKTSKAVSKGPGDRE